MTSLTARVEDIPAENGPMAKADQLFAAGQTKQAERAYRKIVNRDPANIRAQSRLAAMALDRGTLDIARTALGAALSHAPDEPDLHQLLGRLLDAQGRAQEAISAFASAINLKPDHLGAHRGLAPLLHRQGRHQEARKSANIALTLAPKSVSLLLLLADIEEASKAPDAALAALTKAAQIDPDNVTTARRLSEVLLDLGKIAEAAVWGNRAFKLAPADGRTALSYALALDAARQYQEVINVLEKVKGRGKLKPFELAFAENLIARAETSLGRRDRALAPARRAIEIAPDDATYASTYCRALRNLGRTEDAVAYAKALRKRLPDDHSAAIVLAFATREAGDFETAETLYTEVLANGERRAEASFGLAMIQLTEGRYVDGFRNYEARLEPPMEVIRPKPPLEMWDGCHDPDVTLIVMREQGLGDEFQFARFLSAARDRVGDVQYVTYPSMARILGPATRGINVSADSFSGSKSDGRKWRWIPMMSLPNALQLDAAGLGMETPYLEADPVRAETMRQRLAEGRIKIGIAWQGSPTSQVETGRSIPLADFAPLAGIDGVHLYSLQKGYGLDQIDSVAFRDRLTQFDVAFDAGDDAFMDTAAAMVNLDLVVTSDTSIAHLAGALGVKCWVILQHHAEWRWGRSGSSTIWYPSTRLYRQPSPGDWGSAMKAAARDLGELMS